MIIYHSHTLHVRIADGGTNKLEAALFQIFTHSIALRAARRYIRDFARTIDYRFAIDKPPDILAKAAEFFLNFEKSFCVSSDRKYFKPVANDPRVKQEFFKLCIGEFA